jgi:NarL family two-component system response regulator LiaR
MPKPIRLLIVDDHTVVRSALHLMLELKPGLEVVGEAQDGFEAIEQARRVQPDVILMDLEMPRLGGLEAIAAIHRAQPWIRILVLTSFVADQKIAAAIGAGAQNYLLKNSTPAELVAAIHEVHAGQPRLAPDIAARLVAGLQQSQTAALTRREAEILHLAVSGMSNAEIATRLCVAPGTVRFHFSHICRKLQAANRSQAILTAIRTGWADPNTTP